MQILFLVLCGVLILVNGWTDAPNSIVTAVTTKALSVRKAVILAALFNFLGTAIAGVLFPGVSETVLDLGAIGETDSGERALAALTAGIFSAESYAVIAALLGLPTSESHGMMAGICGAMFALSGHFSASGLEALGKIGAGLLLSTLPSAVLGYLICRFCTKTFGKTGEKEKDRYYKRFRRMECGFALAASFLHGAQDGGKFAGILVLGGTLLSKIPGIGELQIPMPLLLFTAALLAAGTLGGGKKITRKIGEELVSLDAFGGASSDGAAALVLVFCTISGLPVSTTHAKACAMIGAGYGAEGKVDKKVMGELFLAWILTFPVCFGLGFGAVRFFLF